MTVRGGGVPTCFLGFHAEGENGSAARSFATDAHGSIMVRVLGATEYKVVARLTRARKAGSPPIIIPTAPGVPSCWKVKVRPGKDGAWRKVGATADLVTSCARRPERRAARDEETGFQIEQRTYEDAPP
jgi:hypothetical protein